MFASIYYGKISKDETERLLEKYGREGSFLARDSETVPGSFCLCVRRDTFVHTYRISQTSGKWAVKAAPAVTPQLFETLDKLIDTYRRAAPSTMAPLLYPLDKTALNNSNQNKGRTGVVPFYQYI
ncbi:SH2 domain-containing protein 1A-like isoform X1 [Acipenser oxyrinchus oxyrinchus]|uniref:SH2 domain-containing protein 1A-like isoform X1 n=1 Tax=Acipenser oxyrinchus oxyrinchus TaxID=40147 RepID=A0AAD8DGG2_ACIOX|nr:SH2 domain-containing protein 1A-like isoform X1 [Acipenser oxyrinchus oxyrinchus]